MFLILKTHTEALVTLKPLIKSGKRECWLGQLCLSLSNNKH